MYFINKANAAVDDEFFSEIESGDIDNLKKAKRRILTLPLLTFAVTYLIKQFRNRIFISNNFLLNIMTLRQKYQGKQYKSKTYEERKESVDKLASPYKAIAEEAKAQKSAVKQAEPVKSERVKLRSNPDPFDGLVKKRGIIPSMHVYSEHDQRVVYKNAFEGRVDDGVPGNQIMNRGSAYSNLLRRYTDYENNAQYEKSVLSAAERDEKRTKRFRFLRKIDVNKIRDKVMKSNFRSRGWMFVLIPTVLSVVAGISNYATVYFGVYLKYQAMVDTYYQSVVLTKELQAKEETTNASSEISTSTQKEAA